ncbi:BMC domain-containing protein [Alkaliphilus peptidifermentans]|uniref:BMC domain-containing protein n=1 Tax=Alkaliphilus peptidifermentans DSM 18978 TaxID=1120976 RepID=A0A1G5KVN5_9FIRM|nr:BMC domain-containing protein [Alkaliphilus peptidifermentans]SCZ04665.1 BMC domain-containing protein [Alkaliphilus peptidifermentans DSM 18978]
MKQALGFIETRSLVAAIQAADTMVKSADVTIADFNYVGSGIVAVVVAGEVAAVQAAVANGIETASEIAEIISSNVIARPHDEVDKLLVPHHN